MEVTRKSPLSGKTRTIDIPGLTQEMLDLWKAGELIQKAMPNVSRDLREFIMTGVIKEEWEETFGT